MKKIKIFSNPLFTTYYMHGFYPDDKLFYFFRLPVKMRSAR